MCLADTSKAIACGPYMKCCDYLSQSFAFWHCGFNSRGSYLADFVTLTWIYAMHLVVDHGMATPYGSILETVMRSETYQYISD